MIISEIEKITKKVYDVIIIGSGPAGIALGTSFQKNNIKILLIEAGDIHLFDKSNNFTSGKVIGSEYLNFENSRIRRFGGTSAIWGGNCNLLDSSDFESWPFNKEELDKYQERAKKILNIKKNFFSEKIDTNIDILNLQWSNVDFNKKYINFFKKSKNIDLITNTTFSHFEGKFNNVTQAVVYNNKKFTLRARFYVLACGGLENSRLLEWTRKNNSSLIDKKLPIGKYYMDHPYFLAGSGIINTNNFKKFLLKKKHNLGIVIECERSLHFSPNQEFLIRNKLSDLKIQIKFKDLSNTLRRQIICVAPKFFKNLLLSNDLKNMSEVTIHAILEQKPHIKNRISLDNSKDPLGIPRIKLLWNLPENIKESLEIFFIDLSDFLIKNNLGRIAINNMAYDTGKIILGNHQLGGTRAGISRDNSVVDKNLKVHGVDNLFITGSSIFCTGGHAHPTFTIVQLSVRLAEFLSQQLEI